jgi:phage shock protein PspC (stress-responsive transcriptional regulator)
MEEKKEVRKLYRSSSDRMISGVCGGLAEHFEIDPTLVRVIFIVLALMSGVGVIIYLALALLVPSQGKEDKSPKETMKEGAEEIGQKARQVATEVGEGVKRAASRARAPGTFLLGLVLVLIGVWFLLQNLGFVWPLWMDFHVIWPVLLILLGLFIFVKRARGN